jgi:hypothetical protein
MSTTDGSTTAMAMAAAAIRSHAAGTLLRIALIAIQA